MNPYRIYRDEWQQALATQAEAVAYSTFVAMPFRDSFSYRATEVLTHVIEAAADEATRSATARRPFAKPERVGSPMGAAVITEEIVQRILQSHFFVADVTFQNPGVLLETGIALATKPGRQIILITQGTPAELHFDLRGNNVIGYGPSGSVPDIAKALLLAAEHFEQQLNYYVTNVARRLGADAMLALKWYGTIQREHGGYALHAQQLPPFLQVPDGRLRFEAATRELRERDLLWTDYEVDVVPGGDSYGMHATELGWALIGQKWPDLRRRSKPSP